MSINGQLYVNRLFAMQEYKLKNYIHLYLYKYYLIKTLPNLQLISNIFL